MEWNLFLVVMGCAASALWFRAEKGRRKAKGSLLPPEKQKAAAEAYFVCRLCAWILAGVTVLSWLGSVLLQK
jgi:hypothetical protein